MRRSKRFEAAGSPKFVSRCHCLPCRKATGAAFSTWVGFRDEQVQWSGAAFYSSSTGVKRGFCKSCGTPLSYQGEKWSGETHFLIGVFDQPDVFTPQGDVFADEALAWAAPHGS